jgi:hypothetical protein
VIAYDPTGWHYNAGRAIELGWYARGAGSFRWGSYRSDLLYPQGPHKTLAEFTDDKRLFPFSDFYLLGGPNTQPKLTGCAKPVVPSYPPWEETPTPKEPPVPNVTPHQWVEVEWPKLDAQFVASGLPKPNTNMVAFMTLRRFGFFPGEVWSFERLMADLVQQGKDNGSIPKEEP